MINFEGYKEDISQVGVDFMSVVNGKVVDCTSHECEECQFYSKSFVDCGIRKTAWLYEEYQETYKLSKLEHYLLQYLNDCKIIEISRNRYGVIRFTTDQGACQKSILLSNLFMFVKDNSSRKVKDILENCEVEE